MIAAITSTYGMNDSKDGYIIKLNNLGYPIWEKTFDKGLDDWVSGITELSGGDFIVSGKTNSTGNGGFDLYLAKFNSNGDEIWFNTYGGIDDDSGGGIIISKDSAIVLTGSTYSFGQGSNDVYLIKTNLDGDTLWTKTYGGNNIDIGGSIFQTEDNGFIIGGITYSFGNGSEIYIIKTNENGYAGVNYNRNTSCKFNISPNPCTEKCNIMIQDNYNKNVSLQIFDINGKMVFCEDNLFLNVSNERMSKIVHSYLPFSCICSYRLQLIIQK